jgi:hypothetical protein
MATMAPVTLDNLNARVLERLCVEAQRRGVDVKAVIKEIIENELGPLTEPDTTPLHHELDALAGTWSAEEAAAFLSTIADSRQCDSDLWQ